MAVEHVLVTGAAGFIGSHLAAALVGEGRRVRAFIRYNSRNDEGALRFLPPDVYSEIEVVRGDLRDPDAVSQAVSGCRVVYHLGAQIAIPYSYVHPLDFVQTNVVGTSHVLTACLRSGEVERVIHTSTSEVYGTAQTVPMDEDHPLSAQSPYSASKIGADALARSYYLSFDLPVVIIRPFNTYGPRQSARAIVPTILTQILAGDTLALGALSPKRDLNFVTDIVAGFIAAGRAGESVLGQVINLGTGVESSIEDLVRAASKVLNKEVRVVADTERLRPDSSEVFRLCANAERAWTLMGWKPRVSLEEGLLMTAEWIGRNPDFYRSGRYET